MNPLHSFVSLWCWCKRIVRLRARRGLLSIRTQLGHWPGVGGTERAEKFAGEPNKVFSLVTLVQRSRLPTIWATIALDRGYPNRAVDHSGCDLDAGIPDRVSRNCTSAKRKTATCER
jgi:hypothetical protein